MGETKEDFAEVTTRIEKTEKKQDFGLQIDLGKWINWKSVVGFGFSYLAWTCFVLACISFLLLMQGALNGSFVIKRLFFSSVGFAIWWWIIKKK